MEISSDGEMLSQLDLAGGLFSYFTGIRQPEGIAIDDEGRIYICGEPNLLYIFSPGYEGIGI